jgi:hypothetical protein
MIRRYLPASALVLLLGCPPPEDTEKPDDTGFEETDTPDTYEEGCITVDGDGGYASLNDAIFLADEGATIEVCEGSFMEAVVVDKAVHIVGAGVDLTSFDAPQGEAPFLFQAVSGASLSGMSILSSRSAVELEESDGVALSDLSFDSVANYAIDADGCTDLDIAGSSFTASQWGAVRVSGGDATVSGSTFTDNLGFAVKGTAGAELSIQGNTITGTMYTELTDEKTIEDGFAVFLEEAGVATLSENVFEANPILSVWAIQGDGLSMSGDSITGGLYGVYAIYGDLDLLDVSITDATEMGILYLANTGEALTAEGLSISGDPEVVADYAWDEGVVSSIGLYVEGSDISLHDSVISGYNSYGAFLVGNTDTDGALLLDTVTFDNNGRRGIFSSDLDATATGLTISNLRELDEDYDGAIYIDLPAAWYHQSGDIEIDGAAFTGNQGWGLSAAQSNSTITNSSFEANGRAGFIDFAGTSNITGSTFTGSLDASNFGALCAYQSNGMLVQGNSFSSNAQWEKTRVYEDAHGNKTVYQYHDEVYDQGLDLYAYEATVTITENSFEDGYLGAQVYSSDGEIRDNSFSGYAYAAIYVGGEGSDAVTVVDNTITQGIGYGLMASSADVEVQNLSVTDARSELISYDYYYNGDKIFSSSYYTSYDGVYLSNSRALLEDVVVDSPAGEGLYSYNSTVELESVTIRNASSATTSAYAAYFYHYDSPPEIYVDGLTIESPQGTGGIYLYSYATKSFVAADFEGVTITDPVGDGVVMSSFATNEDEAANFVELEVTGAGGDAVSMNSSSATFVDSLLQGATEAGITASSSTLGLTATLIEGNGGDGLYASSSAVTVDSCEIVTNTGDGVELISSSASLDNSTITANEGYGIRCSAATFDSCGDNTISLNTLGDNNGCDASCGGEGGVTDTAL